jgi:hypothetical protein
MSDSLDINLQTETLNVTDAILERYNVPGPRYTSYPTAPEWMDAFGPDDFARALAESNAGSPAAPLSIYAHLPFCESLCLFCGCNVVINKDHEVLNPYLGNLRREIDQISVRVDRSRPVVQMHWGGGTPTYLSPAQMEELFHWFRDHFTLAADAEVGIEIDPRTTSEAHITALARMGFNRVSMGIQDFNPVVQKTIHRIQPYEMTKAVFDLPRAKIRVDQCRFDLWASSSDSRIVRRFGGEGNRAQSGSSRHVQLCARSLAEKTARLFRPPHPAGHGQISDFPRGDRAFHARRVRLHRHGSLRPPGR